MKFPFFASFIIFIIWLYYEISKSKKKNNKIIQDFWERESAANSVRKKPLDALPYIQIPYDILPDEQLSDDPKIKEALQTIENLREKKIVNLTGITNTELKLTYGTANLTILSEYDQNYTEFSTALYSLGETLYHAGYIKEAIPLLEYGITTKTDISGNYRILYEYYCKTENLEKINWLRNTAESLNSVMKNTIIRLLWGYGQTGQSTDPYNG